jgi:uncharacterized membrane-anchored protein YjiN (DUF445 family)
MTYPRAGNRLDTPRMTLPDPDVEARRALARHRAFATALLVLMGALMVASYALPPGPWTDLLQAASKAGLVGGIADWFAVVALFRHPLGLPIPHTAILPAQKERLGRALGRFVANHVMTQAEVSRLLGQLDLSGIFRRFLTDPATARPAAQALAAMLPRLLASVEDGRARRLTARLVPRLLGGAAAGQVVARALRGLVQGNRHQEVLDFLLDELKKILAAKEEQLRLAIEEKVREQGGRLFGWALGATFANRIISVLQAELDRIGPESGLREAFDEWVKTEIARMETDPERAAEIGRSIRDVMSHATVQAWLWDVWARLRVALENDASRPNGHTVGLLESGFVKLGTVLATDAKARARLQVAAESVVASVMPSAQAQLAEFIAHVVAGWDTATITEKLELRVGKDLQFVRVNGTLVGFLVGGLLYAILQAIFGHAAF